MFMQAATGEKNFSRVGSLLPDSFHFPAQIFAPFDTSVHTSTHLGASLSDSHTLSTMQPHPVAPASPHPVVPTSPQPITPVPNTPIAPLDSHPVTVTSQQ